MENSEDIHNLLDTRLGETLLELTVKRRVDLDSLTEIGHLAMQFTRTVKSEALVRKTWLKTLRSAMKSLRAEAPYISTGRLEMLQLADELEMAFDLIIWGEDDRDRVPSAPRVLQEKQSLNLATIRAGTVAPVARRKPRPQG
jgi:hypothetical protein